MPPVNPPHRRPATPGRDVHRRRLLFPRVRQSDFGTNWSPGRCGDAGFQHIRYYGLLGPLSRAETGALSPTAGHVTVPGSSAGARPGLPRVLPAAHRLISVGMSGLPPGSHGGGPDSGRYRRAPSYHRHLMTTTPERPSMHRPAWLDQARGTVLPHGSWTRPAQSSEPLG